MLLNRYIFRNTPFRFTCSTCLDGKPKIEGQFNISEPIYSKEIKKRRDWDERELTERFAAKYVCEHEGCGEIYHLSGDLDYFEDFDDEAGPVIACAKRIKCFYPTPNLIEIPPYTPSTVKFEIKKSFEVFGLMLNQR